MCTQEIKLVGPINQTVWNKCQYFHLIPVQDNIHIRADILCCWGFCKKKLMALGPIVMQWVGEEFAEMAHSK